MGYQFKIESGTVHLTDPCYDLNDPCFNKACGIYNVLAKNGTWVADVSVLTHAQTGGRGNRVESFEVWHKDANKQNLNIKPIDCVFGVDSGQFGICDTNSYVGDPYASHNRDWYFHVCDLTLGDDMCGVIKDGTGFFSSTGYGDGWYYGEAAFENQELVYFKSVFIQEHQHEE